jgi:hypothetical protein
LIEIKSDLEFDMDLSNSKIKTINHFLPCARKFNFATLKKTLDQAAPSLEKLRLEFLYAEEHGNPTISYPIGGGDEDEEKWLKVYEDDELRFLVECPIFPKLTNLELISAHGCQVGRHIKNLVPERLPNLKYLKLSTKPKLTNRKKKDAYQYGSIVELTIFIELAESQVPFQHPGVVYLSLNGVGNPQLLKDLILYEISAKMSELTFTINSILGWAQQSCTQ